MAAERQISPSTITADELFNIRPEDYALPAVEPMASTPVRGRHRASADLPPEALALLDTIASGESPDYNTIYGGKKVGDLSWHPGIAQKIASGPNQGKTSTAAGRYQFLEPTWNDQAIKLGLQDFSPRSQDIAAWNLAQEGYADKTGRDLLSDLRSGNPAIQSRIGPSLAHIWTSLPGGIETSTNTNRFVNAYRQNLGSVGQRPMASLETQGYEATPPETPEAAPSYADMYNIVLGNGGTLHVRNGVPREQAIEEAKANGIEGPFLKDIPLTNGGVLHVPEDMADHDALEEARKQMPDQNIMSVKEQQHAEKTGFLASAKSAGLEGTAQILRGVSEMAQGTDLGPLKSLGDIGIEKAKAMQEQAAGMVEAPDQYDPWYTKYKQMAGEVAGGVLPYVGGAALGTALAPEAAVAGLTAGTMGVQALGSMAERADQQGKDFEVAPALPAAMLETAVNYGGMKMLGPLKGVIGEFGTPEAAKAIAKMVEKEGYTAAEKAVGSKLSNIAAETGLNASGIAIGNVASSIIERAQSGQSLTDQAAFDEYAKGLESGIVGGGMFGVPYGMARKGAKEAALEQAGEGMRQAAPHPLEGERVEGPEPKPEPPPQDESGAQFPPPEGTNWYDQLGLNKQGKTYKSLEKMDLMDTDDHPHIKDILEKHSGYTDSASVENLFKYMEGADTAEAEGRKTDFAGKMGYDTGTVYTDNLGRTGTYMSAKRSPDLGEAVKVGDTTAALDSLQKSPNPVTRWLAEKAKNLPNLKIWQDDKAIRDLEKARRYPKGTVGGYYSGYDGGIRIAGRHIDNEHVVSHEVMHANVMHALENPQAHQRASVMALNKLYDEIKSHPILQAVQPGVTRGKEYGITNVHEFVSEGLTNPEFQYKLSRIRYEGTTLWNKFTQSIANLLGLKRDNAFMELMTHTENLMPKKGEKVKPSRMIMAGKTPEEIAHAREIKSTEPPYAGRGPRPESGEEVRYPAEGGEGVRVSDQEGQRLAGEGEGKEEITRGINVRSDVEKGIDYSNLLVSGQKKYETRDSDSLRPYVGKRVAIIRTGEGQAKIVGEVTLGEPIVVDEAKFRKLQKEHLVPPNSTFDIKPGSTKYLYPVTDPVKYQAEQPAPAGGIRARKLVPTTREEVRPSTDSTGAPIHTTEEGVKNFWKGFKDSKVVDEEGRPVKMYHGTRGDIVSEKDPTKSAFDREGLGSHFTSDRKVATGFAESFGPEEGSVFPTYLNIKNPLRIKDFEGSHSDATSVAQDFIRQGILPKGYVDDAFYSRIMANPEGKTGKEFDAVYAKNNAKELARIRDLLESKGYDGLVYHNEVEGGGDAYIPFRAEQIKSAIGNKGEFDTSKADIRAAGMFERPSTAKPKQVDPDLEHFEKRGLTKATDTSGGIGKKITDFFHNLDKKSSFDVGTRLRAHLVNRYAPWTTALKDKEWMNKEGKMRADYMASKWQQIQNTIRTGQAEGYGIVGPDGTVVINPHEKLALDKIMKRIDDMDLKGYNSRQVVADVLRTLRGETLLNEDAAMRNHIQALRASADRAESASKRTTNRADIIKEQKRADSLRAEANRLEEVFGKTEGEGRELRVTREDITRAKAILNKFPEVKQAVDDIHSVNKRLVDLWEQAELIDAATADKWRNSPAYIPLYKSDADLLTDPSQYFSRMGKGTKSVAEVERLLGGAHDVNVFENLYKHYAFMTSGAAQNLLRRHATDQLSQVNAMKRITEAESRNNPLAVMFKAKDNTGAVVKHYYEALDPLTFEAFQSSQPLTHPLFTQFLRPTTQFFRAATLMNPAFWFKQLIRDPIHASMVADTGIITPLQAASAMAKILAGKSETYTKLSNEGVVGAIEQFKDPKEFAESLGRKPGTIKNIFNKLEHVHEATDAATRVAVYESSYKRAKKRGMSDEKAHSFATLQAREMINFTNMGRSQMMQAIRTSVPFFSATMNSLDVVARAAMGQGMPPAQRKAAMQLFYTRAAALAGLSAAYALAMQDNEDYRKLANTNDWMRNYLIPNPAEKGGFIKVPIPFEIGYFTKVLPELWIRLANGTLSSSEAKQAGVEGALATLPPLPIPQVMRVFFETTMNHDLFTGRPIEKLGQENLPVEERGRYQASEIANIMSKELGLSKLRLSPAKIDHLGRGMATELWSTTALLSDAYLHKDNPRALKSLSETLPMGLGSLFAKPDTNRIVNTFYKAEESAKQRRQAMIEQRKTGRKEEYKAAMADPESRAQFQAAVPLRRVADDLSSIRQRMAKIDENPKLSQEQKTAQIKKLKETYNKIAERGARIAQRFGLE